MKRYTSLFTENALSSGLKLPIFYHMTKKSNIDGILKNGLLPSKGQSQQSGIYLATDVSTAQNYKGFRGGEKSILLRIDPRYIDKTKLGPDDYEFQDYLDSNEDNDNEDNWKRWSDYSWYESMEAVSQVVYFGIIPPEAIRVIKI